MSGPPTCYRALWETRGVWSVNSKYVRMIQMRNLRFGTNLVLKCQKNTTHHWVSPRSDLTPRVAHCAAEGGRADSVRAQMWRGSFLSLLSLCWTIWYLRVLKGLFMAATLNREQRVTVMFMAESRFLYPPHSSLYQTLTTYMFHSWQSMRNSLPL